MQQWLFLLAAIAFEAVATTSLKLSQGFTKIVGILVVVAGIIILNLAGVHRFEG